MSLGERISKARKDKKMTQAELAEIIGVSTEDVSKWERDRYVPSPEKLEKLYDKLGLSYLEFDGSPRNLRFYNEEHMTAFLKGKLNSGRYPEAAKALCTAKKMHAGAFRKPEEAKIPYISHPITMACHAFALGLDDDILLAAVFLHDVAEDCGVSPGDLPVDPEVQRIVALVTKPEKKPFSEKNYYDGIMDDPKACLVKCLDRCNNLSSMPMGFSDAKIAEYVSETEKYYPGLLRVIKEVPEYNNAAWLLDYQMKGLLAMAKRIGRKSSLT